jgi:3-oxoadipate enol-lactonase
VIDALPSRAIEPAEADGPGRYLARDGVRLHYRNDGTGPAVVFVHGWTLDQEMWTAQVRDLAGDFRVLRIDRRGFGLSGGQPSIATDADDLVALVNHLKIECVALVGMSQGVRPVLASARILGPRVTCLVLDGPPDLTQPAASLVSDGPFGRYAELAQSRGLDEFRRAWSAHPLMQLRTSDARARSLLAAMIERYPGGDLLAAVQPAFERPPRQIEALPEAPVLVLCGSHDLPERIAAARTLARRLPHGELALVEDAGHLPNLDSPRTYNRLVHAFLSRYATART